MNDKKDTENKVSLPETSTKEYKNDNVTVQAQCLPGCNVKLDITVTPKASKATYKKAIKSINKEVSLPGFRKGKAPEAMITQNYSSYVDQEWKEILVQTAFKEAVALAKLYPLNQDSIKKPKIKNANQEEGAEISIEFESAPTIPSISPEELTLKRVEKKEVTEEQVQESLEDIQIHHAEWKDIEDRGVEEGDYIDIDIQDNENPERYICKDTRFEVAKGKIGDWMRKLVIGKKVNDSVVGMSERSDEMDSEAEFKPTQCKITIKAIKNATLPKVDEELAKKVGAESVEDLLEKIKKNLNSQADESVQRELRNQLDDIIVEKYPFEVPTSLIQREIKNRIDTLKRAMEKSGSTAEEINEKIEQSRSSIEKEASKAFQLFFIARQIADDNNIQITQDELIKELMLQMYTQPSTLDTSLDPEEARSKVYINLLSQKVKDFLINGATIV